MARRAPKEKKVHFIHITKTGGTTIHQSLSPWLVELTENDFGFDFDKRFYYASDLPARLKRPLLMGMSDRIVFVTSVRNPWDRLVSLYFSIKQKGFNLLDFKAACADKVVKQFKTFYDFCLKLPQLKISSHRTKWQPGQLAASFNPQVTWLKIGKKLCLPQMNVIRFETLEKDLKSFADKYNFGIDEVPHLNKSKHDPYYEYYTRKMKRIVAEIYAEDIATFGYKYDELDES